MSNISNSPSHYPEDAFTADANFKIQINQNMKVPDKISFNQNINGLSQTAGANKESLNMQVPERILVAGQNKHIGTTAPPREIIYDNSIIQSDPYQGIPRVATPPRSLTLDKYPFPTLNDLDEEKFDQKEKVIRKRKVELDDSDMILPLDPVPAIGGGGDSLTPAQEILHLRKQLAKLNRRVIDLEIDKEGRLQKEKVILGVTFTYFLMKFLFWMSRN